MKVNKNKKAIIEDIDFLKSLLSKFKKEKNQEKVAEISDEIKRLEEMKKGMK